MKIAQIEQRPQNRDCIFNLQLYIPDVLASAGEEYCCNFFPDTGSVEVDPSQLYLVFFLCQFVTCKRKGLEDCYTETEDRERVIAVYFQIVVRM
jgi:hypothetical protein